MQLCAGLSKVPKHFLCMVTCQRGLMPPSKNFLFHNFYLYREECRGKCPHTYNRTNLTQFLQYTGIILEDIITAKKAIQVIKGGDKKRQNAIQFQTHQFLLRLPENLLVRHNIVVFIKRMKQQELITLGSSTHQRPRLLNKISFLNLSSNHNK